jgi:hypothetical protein
VIAARGSFDDDHAATGGRSSNRTSPSAASVPTRTWRMLLAIDQESSLVSAVMSPGSTPASCSSSLTYRDP